MRKIPVRPGRRWTLLDQVKQEIAAAVEIQSSQSPMLASANLIALIHRSIESFQIKRNSATEERTQSGSCRKPRGHDQNVHEIAKAKKILRPHDPGWAETIPNMLGHRLTAKILPIQNFAKVLRIPGANGRELTRLGPIESCHRSREQIQFT